MDMAFSKKNEFPAKDRKLAELAKALSHPARIAILRGLARRGTCVCGEIVEVLPLAQSTVSRHLQELKDAGLIQGQVSGPKSCYCIDWKNLAAAQEALQSLFGDWAKARASCC
jgi:ArsR family transcriptional regulator, arsenate/arsenite/antimonite-responsive transcriptional repressor